MEQNNPNAGRRPNNYARLTMVQKRQIAKQARRRGDVTRVARKTGFAISTVSEVLSGKYNNKRIVNAAYDMSRGRKNAKATAQ
jgi:hypothetical protein